MRRAIPDAVSGSIRRKNMRTIMQETLKESLNSFLQKNFHTLNLLKSSFFCLNIFPVGFDTSTILFLLQFFQASLKFLLTVDVINLSMEITDNQLCLQIDVVIILCPLIILVFRDDGFLESAAPFPYTEPLSCFPGEHQSDII